MNVDIRLSSADLQELSQQVALVLYDKISKSSPALLRKHAYTVAEVAQQIGYSADTVCTFIRKGRKARNGKIIKLDAKQPTPSDYRIMPADLDAWLSHF